MTGPLVERKQPPQGDSTYGWDWSATTHEGREPKVIARDLLGALDPHTVLPGKGLHGWSRSLEAFDPDGYRLGSVYLGGREDVFFVSTSEAADRTRDHAVTVDAGRTARVDTRVDSLMPFDELAGILCDAADIYGSKITYMESGWRPGKHETQGRTVYLGSPKSPIRVRLYEKWLESPGQYVEGVNRVEVQLRPASKVKAAVSGWSRAQTFGASKVCRELAARLGQDLAPKVTVHVSRGTPDLERSIEAMGQQYGRAVDRWVEHTGGDVSTVLDYLFGRETRRERFLEAD